MLGAILLAGCSVGTSVRGKQAVGPPEPPGFTQAVHGPVIQLASTIAFIPASHGNFVIVSQSPLYRYTIPNVITSITAGICVIVPMNGNYVWQVAANPGGPWMTRGGSVGLNGVTNCWRVRIEDYETNRFFIRVRTQ